MTDADARTVEQYLVSQNRPWNVGSLVLNLHKAVGKTAAETVLTKLSSGDDCALAQTALSLSTVPCSIPPFPSSTTVVGFYSQHQSKTKNEETI